MLNSRYSFRHSSSLISSMDWDWLHNIRQWILAGMCMLNYSWHCPHYTHPRSYTHWNYKDQLCSDSKCQRNNHHYTFFQEIIILNFVTLMVKAGFKGEYSNYSAYEVARRGVLALTIVSTWMYQWWIGAWINNYFTKISSIAL